MAFAATRVLTILFTLTLILWAGSPVLAHKVNVFAYVEGDAIRVEGYFGGAAKAKQCRVEVFDSAGNKVCEGKTDDQGICLFRLQDVVKGTGEIRIVLHAGTGHMADYTVAAGEIPSVASIQSSPEERSGRASSPEIAREADGKEGPARTGPEPAALGDPDAVKKALGEVLDERIRPLERMLGNQHKLLLEQQRKGPSMAEIIGGIGWILGMVGIAAYFMSLKKVQKRE
ncbi:MAG: hypothetical protein FJY85_06645 [Deltaproteobacteria bacterium]|nr:hypothetical protein [Deltaproteobacteria bacterium]